MYLNIFTIESQRQLIEHRSIIITRIIAYGVSNVHVIYAPNYRCISLYKYIIVVLSYAINNMIRLYVETSSQNNVEQTWRVIQYTFVVVFGNGPLLYYDYIIYIYYLCTKPCKQSNQFKFKFYTYQQYFPFLYLSAHTRTIV